MKIDYITPSCSVCERHSVLFLDEEALIAYHNGMHVQDAFPDLTPDERELVISGTHSSCWDILFGDF